MESGAADSVPGFLCAASADDKSTGACITDWIWEILSLKGRAPGECRGHRPVITEKQRKTIIGRLMKKKKNDYKKYKFTYIKTTLGTLFLGILFLKGYTPFQPTGENFFHIRVNGQEVGTLGDRDRRIPGAQ